MWLFYTEELKDLNTTDMLHVQVSAAKHYAHKSLYVTGLLENLHSWYILCDQGETKSKQNQRF